MIATSHSSGTRYRLHNPVRKGDAWESSYTNLKKHDEYWDIGTFYDHAYDFAEEPMIATDKHSGHRFELHNPVRTAEHIVSDYTNLTTGNRSNQGYFRYDWYDFEPKQAAPQEPPIYRVAFSGNSIGEQEVIADDPRQAVAAVMSGSHAPDAWYRVEAPDGNTTWWRPVRIANDWPADYHGPDAKYAVIPR